MGKVGFLMSVFVCVLCVSEAAVYPVGDEQGWKEYVNYTEWIASKTFFVGDIIVFEYDKERENVMMVSLDDFHSCSSNRPIRIYQTGLDKFILEKRTHLFFICGFPDHCLRGQKVHIRVLELDRPALPPLTTTRPSRNTRPLLSNSFSPPPQPRPSKQGPSPSLARGGGASVMPWGWALTLGFVTFVAAIA